MIDFIVTLTDYAIQHEILSQVLLEILRDELISKVRIII